MENTEKIKAVAKDFNAPEKENASRILAKRGIYIDKAGIEWTDFAIKKFDEKKRKYLFGFDPLLYSA